MIDRLREQIQHRLDQLLGEADRLREALAALDPRSSPPPTRRAPAGTAPIRAGTRAATSEPKVTASLTGSTRRARRATPKPTPPAPRSATTRPARTATPEPKAPATAEAPGGRASAAAPEPKAPTRRRTTSRRASTAAPEPKARSTNGGPTSAATAAPPEPPTRTAPGATKASVLAALAGGQPMTAGQVANKAGLARATVSTTLSKLAKTGEVQKAERGYQLPQSIAPTEAGSPSG